MTETLGKTEGPPPGPTEDLPASVNARYKRPFDLAVLVASHLVLAPFLLLYPLIALLVWLEDRGPIFFRQQRIGKDGRVFSILKFRTMVPDADKFGPDWTLDSDVRVTKVGRVLRRTALDELPQLLSIWKGDMSFVGPRALAVREQKHLEEQIPGFHQRLRVPMGLTGLAQVYNQDDDDQAKLGFDLEYIQQMSPFLDMKLLVLSVAYTFRGRWDRRGKKVDG